MSPKIAAIITTYYSLSHADVIPTKYMKGFPTDSGLLLPQVDLASIYLDQIDPRDVGCQLAAQYNIPIYQSIRQSLTLGGKELAVDGVLLIGEHGDYPHNEYEQHMYPRRYMFEQICGVFASSDRSVPIFCDKHLSYNWMLDGCMTGHENWMCRSWLDHPYPSAGGVHFWNMIWTHHWSQQLLSATAE